MTGFLTKNASLRSYIMAARARPQLAWRRAVQRLWFRFSAIKDFGVSSVIRDLYPAQLTRSVQGSMIHKAGAGPEPIPHKQLNVAKLTEAIKFAISPSAKIAAKAMADQIKAEV